MTRGWWSMHCWNGLSPAQQRRLISVGNLPIDYKPEGRCELPARVCVETEWDEAPGPRFYCLPCAIKFLGEKHIEELERSNREGTGA